MRRHRHKYLGDDSDMVCIAPGKCTAKQLTKTRGEWVLVIERVPTKPKPKKRRT